MEPAELKDLVTTALEAVKASNVVSLDVRKLTDITDYMVVAGGTSTRHVKALAEHVTDTAKRRGVRPLGVEGENTAEWILVDFGDVVTHLMLPLTRDFYALERLWSTPPGER